MPAPGVSSSDTRFILGQYFRGGGPARRGGGATHGIGPDRLGRENATEEDVPAKLTSREGYVLPEEILQRGGSEDVPAKLTSREGYVLEGGGNSGIREEGRAPDLDRPRGKVFLGAIRGNGRGSHRHRTRDVVNEPQKNRNGRGGGGGLTRGIDVLRKVLSPAHLTRLMGGEGDRGGRGGKRDTAKRGRNGFAMGACARRGRPGNIGKGRERGKLGGTITQGAGGEEAGETGGGGGGGGGQEDWKELKDRGRGGGARTGEDGGREIGLGKRTGGAEHRDAH